MPMQHPCRIKCRDGSDGHSPLPFELVHNLKPDSKTGPSCFPSCISITLLTTTCTRLNTNDQFLDGIVVGRDKSTTVVFNNPLTKSYYSRPAFKLDEAVSRPPTFPHHVKYGSSLTCCLLALPSRHPRHAPSGRPVHPRQCPKRGPDLLQYRPTCSHTTYVVHLDDGSTTEVSYEDLICVDRTNATPAKAAPDAFAGLYHSSSSTPRSR